MEGNQSQELANKLRQLHLICNWGEVMTPPPLLRHTTVNYHTIISSSNAIAKVGVAFLSIRSLVTLPSDSVGALRLPL